MENLNAANRNGMDEISYLQNWYEVPGCSMSLVTLIVVTGVDGTHSFSHKW
jgi:hypothetical protein